MSSIHLQSGDLAATIEPHIGGSISSFRLGDLDLMRSAPPGASLAKQMASFPLVPFSNRIREGQFAVDGQNFQLKRNMDDHPHTIHGIGWQRAWDVESCHTEEVTLGLDHEPSDTDWPFRFEALQFFRLCPDRLIIDMSLTNLDHRPMPAGLGHHPYFPRPETATLSAVLDNLWLYDDRMVPDRRVPVPTEWRFDDGLAVRSLSLDHCFDGFKGSAVISWPDKAVELLIETSATFGHLVIYTPPGKDYFCVEPASHCNDAVNLAAMGFADTGLVMLAPGESLNGQINFIVRPKLA